MKTIADLLLPQGALPREQMRDDTVRLCLTCIEPWFGCPCRGHVLFYPLFALERGWLVKSREVGPA